MAIDTRTPNSPGWWLDKAAKKLKAKQPRLEKLAAYHDGNPPMPKAPEAAADTFKEFYRRSRVNVAELCVGSVRERIGVRAIRTAVETDQNGDAAAWQIWRENNLDIEFADVVENMLALGDGYAIVGLDPDDDERVVVTGEDPRQVVTIHDPVRQSVVRAALKMFHDSDVGKDYAYLYLAGGTRKNEETGEEVDFNARRYVASRPRKSRGSAQVFSASSYEWDEDFGGAEGEELNHKKVPVVRLRNRRGIGEFEPHLDLLDRINHLIFQLSVIATYQAFKQRALRVDEEDMPDKDENNRTINYDDVLTADPGAWLKIPKDAEVWESTQADLQGILSAIKDAFQQFAAVTRTPLSAVSPDAVNQSAEGAALIKEGQIFKTEDKQRRVAAFLAIVYEIAFLCLEDTPRADKTKLIVDFTPAERYSLTAKYDAASKAAPAGEPWESIMSNVLQYPPETIEILRGQVLDQLIRDGISGPAPAAPAPANAA